MSSLKQLAGQTAVYGLSTIFSRFLNYLLVPVYTRVLLTGEYGSVSEFYGYSSFLAVLFTYGMVTSFFRYVQNAENKAKVFSTAWISVMATSAVFVLVLLLFTPQLAALTRNTAHPEYITYFIFILAADAIAAVPFAWLRQQNQAKRFALLQLLSIGINIGLNIFFLNGLPWLGAHGIQAAGTLSYALSGVAYIFLANIASSILILPFFYKELKLLQSGFDKVLWNKMIRYGAPLMVLGLAGMVNETLDRVIMKYLISDQDYAMQQIGIYAANYKLSIVMTLFVQAFRFAAEPFFFSKASDKNAPDLYASVMHYFILVCCVIFLGVALYIDVFKQFIGEAYRGGLHVVPILLMANMFLGVYYNLSVWYKLTDKTHFGASITVLGALITIVLNVLLIPVMGYTGSAWATVVCYFTIMTVSYLIGQRYFPVPYDLKKAGSAIGLALILFMIFQFMQEMYSFGKISYTLLQVAGTFVFIIYLGWIAIMERKKLWS